MAARPSFPLPAARQGAPMPDVTRTVRDWRAAAGRVQAADPTLAARVRATLADAASAHPGEPLDEVAIACAVSDAEAAALERLVPAGAGAVAPGTPAPLGVDEAAAALGLSPAAVRARLRRGTLRGDRTAGGWVVWVPVNPAPPRPAGGDPAALAALVERQADEIRRLAGEAAAWEARAVRAEQRLRDLAAGAAAAPGGPAAERPPPPGEPPQAAPW